MDEQLSMFGGMDLSGDKEDIHEVLRQLTAKPCQDCRLGLLHPNNRGFLWRGSLQAKLAVIGEAPGDQETERGLPFIGPAGQEFDRWFNYLGLDTSRDCFVMNVAQCQPPKEPGPDGKKQQRAPNEHELKICWQPRGLRVLTALPNLEVIVTLGWTAARTILGGDPKSMTHEGWWFTSRMVPGVPIFCMVHPSSLLREPSPEKNGKVRECLDAFRHEYLESKKILDVVKQVVDHGA